MADSHHIMITAILAAVVVVGISGLYFSMNSSEGPSIVYLSSGPTYSGASPGLYKPISQSFAKAVPFKIRGQGITGLEVEQFGTAVITSNLTPDLRMPKNMILCEATLEQGEDMAWLYTCGDVNSTGGTLICDTGAPGGTGSSVDFPTNASTCNATITSPDLGSNGAFVVCNAGYGGSLTAYMAGVQINDINNTNVSIDHYIFNSLQNDPGAGCIGSCNNCPAADTLPLCGTTLGQNVTECDYFNTSGQCLCECFSIHIEDEDDVHLLKSGGTLEFLVKKVIEPASPPCP